MLQVTVPLLEQLTEDDLDGILKYYKEDFNIGGYTYTKSIWREALFFAKKKYVFFAKKSNFFL